MPHPLTLLSSVVLKIPFRLSSLYSTSSFKTRLGLAFGATIFLLSLILSLIVGQTTRLASEREAGSRLAELAYQMSDKLDRGMFERYRDIQIAASLQTLRAPASQPSEQRAFLERLKKTYPAYAWIGLASPQGQVLVATGGLLEGQDVSHRPWFAGGKLGSYAGDVHQAVLLEKLLPPSPGGEPLRFVDVAAPVLDEQGHLQGVLGAHLSWSWASEVEHSLFQQGEDTQFEVMVVSPQTAANPFQLLLGPPSLHTQATRDPASLAGLVQELSNYHQLTRRYLTLTWPDDSTDSYLTGFATSQGYLDYPGLGWMVIVRQKSEVAFAAGRALQLQVLSLGVAFGLLFVGVGWLLARQLSRPLLELSQLAQQIGEGNRQLKLPVYKGQNELATLTNSLSAMTITLINQEQVLRKLNQSLNEQVAQLQTQQGRLIAEIAEREKAEEALREREQDYRLLLEQAADGILISDCSGKYLTVNSTACELLEYQPEELLGLRIEDLLLAEDLAKEPLHQQELALGKIIRIERRICTKSGRTLPVEVSARKFEDGRLQAIIRDISQRKAAEEALRRSEAQLRQSQKMEAVGRLAGGITHDFNNLLTVIMGCNELALLYVEEDTFSTRNYLLEVQKAAQQARLLTGQLLAFSRAQPLQPRLLRLNEVVGEINPLIRRLIKDNVELVVELEPVSGYIKADPGQLGQVIMNLVVNARDAMPGGGRLVIESSTLKLEEAYLDSHSRIAAGSYAVLSVRDSGEGIKAEILPQIFEPFFTTKEAGKGTGLGLSTVYGIVKQSGGQISVVSEVGVGTTFKLFFPLIAPEQLPPENRVELVPLNSGVV
jgi:PAS domain S-box-containing protein